jgi:hypothetical protein
MAEVSGRDLLILCNYFLVARELRARDVRSSPMV